MPVSRASPLIFSHRNHTTKTLGSGGANGVQFQGSSAAQLRKYSIKDNTFVNIGTGVAQGSYIYDAAFDTTIE